MLVPTVSVGWSSPFRMDGRADAWKDRMHESRLEWRPWKGGRRMDNNMDNGMEGNGQMEGRKETWNLWGGGALAGLHYLGTVPWNLCLQ